MVCVEIRIIFYTFSIVFAWFAIAHTWIEQKRRMLRYTSPTLLRVLASRLSPIVEELFIPKSIASAFLDTQVVISHTSMLIFIITFSDKYVCISIYLFKIMYKISFYHHLKILSLLVTRTKCPPWI